MGLPNFLVIGAAKAGTDALCGCLAQHPDVYMSPAKEPNFFVANGRSEIPYRGPGDRETLARHQMWVWSRPEYEALFEGAGGRSAVGEGSTWYLYDPEAPLRIQRLLPDIRLIAVLRSPVERAYSAFTMLRRDGREPEADFMDALRAEDFRIRAGWEPIWHYRHMGLYHEQLSRYLSVFDAGRVHVELHSDFEQHPGHTLRRIFDFLEVDPEVQIDTSERRNVSAVPAHPIYHRLVVGPSAVKSMAKAVIPEGVRTAVKSRLPMSAMKPPPAISREARGWLAAAFREDVGRLDQLLGRDLGSWLKA